MEYLLDYQIKHTQTLVNILKKNKRAVDLSSAGTGKTYTSIVIAKLLNLKPLIICPKSMEFTWIELLKKFNCNYYGISSYELIRNGYYNNPKKTKLEFMEINGEEYKINSIPDDIIIIYDEAHKCKNVNTLNGKILYEMAKTNANILLLSATISDKPIYAILLCFTLKFFNDIRNGKEWISKNIKKHKNYMLGIRDVLFPEHGSRMDINCIVEKSPENKIIAECVDSVNQDEIEKEYENIKYYIDSLDVNTKGIGSIIKSRQKIEILKIQDFVNLTKYHLNKNKSVVIFVNYTETIKQLSKILNTKCVVFGEQTINEREENIKNFNSDKERIIICNIKTGGTGISLHDLNGNYPRISLISPTWSATDLIQSLGRIYRSGVKTNTEQYIIFSNCKSELYIQNNIKNKINSIGLLNDGIMDEPMFKIEGLIEKYIDKETNFGELIEKKKSKKERVFEYKQQKIKEEKYNKDFLPFECLDIETISRILINLNYRKNNILKMNESEYKQKLLKEIDNEINHKNEMIQKIF
jgi:superfamily II DNA/RNA helicase